MIRVALILWLCLLGLGLWAQDTSKNAFMAEARKLMIALVQDDRAAALEQAQRVEAVIDQTPPEAEGTRTQQFLFLANVLFSAGDIEKSTYYYERSAEAAKREGLWVEDIGLHLRYELGNAYLILDRHDDALAVGSSLIEDLVARDAMQSEDGMKALSLVATTMHYLHYYAEAETAARTLLTIADTHDSEGTMIHFAANLLSIVLGEMGRFEEAVPFARRGVEVARGLFDPGGEVALAGRFRLARSLVEAEQYDEARPVIEDLLIAADQFLPPTHEIALHGRRLLERVERAEGQLFAARSLNREISERAAQKEDPLLALKALENLAAHHQAEGDYDAYERTAREAILHAERYDEIPPHRAAQIQVDLGNFLLIERGDRPGAHRMLSAAIPVLTRDLGPDNIDTLTAEVDWFFAKDTEIKTEDVWRRANQKPVFWDGTEAGKAITAHDIDVFRRLAEAYRVRGLDRMAVSTAVNYADILGRVGQHEVAFDVLNDISGAVKQAREQGQQFALEIDFVLTEGVAGYFAEMGKYGSAAQIYQMQVDRIVELLRTTNWLSTIGRGRDLTGYAQLFGQGYTAAAWLAAQTDSDTDVQSFKAMAFEAVQLAGYGPASSAVANASVREKARDPALVELVASWQDSAFQESGNSAPLKAAKTLDQLHKELTERFPEYLEWQVPSPLSLEAVQSQLIAPDEALITFLPGTRQSGKDDAFNGLVMAVTHKKAVFAELPLAWDQLIFDIQMLHSTLDQGPQQAVARAPMESLEEPTSHNAADVVPFAFGPARRLHDALFGQPEIAALIDDKAIWTVVPLGETLSIPFPALVVADPGDRLRRSRLADGLREVRWLGLERALNVVPSVAALADLRARKRADELAPTELAYLAFGDPAFRGDAGAILPGADTILRDNASDRAAALASLPRLPGTRREVETLATLFGEARSQVYLGPRASEAKVQELQDSKTLAQAEIVHFATHGLLGGAFDGVSEPALALAPPVAGLPAEADGLLTASEAGRLTLTADWVILSACDTAGAESIKGDGLGGLVQGFFSAGARNMLVSHWRVDDRAAEQLITRTLRKAHAGTAKAEALRQAMKALAEDTSRDQTSLPNAHPAIWAPFVLVGGG